MRIGVFGDSYADCNLDGNVWFKQLEKYGHNVTSFGSGGSSIMFSTMLLKEKHREFDFNIWCLTTPGRFSFRSPNGEWVHTTNHPLFVKDQHKNIEIQIKLDVCKQYLTLLFDWPQEDFIGQSIAEKLLRDIPNLMIIPCFWSPLGTEFNLSKVCAKELAEFFGEEPVHKIYERYQDIRQAHLTLHNNRVLADLVAKNLRPGIFQTDYNNFKFQGNRLEEMVIPL